MSKKELKKAIGKSKRRKREDLRQDVNNDLWGLGYRIVMQKLGAQGANPTLNSMQMERIVSTLFPTHAVREQEGPSDQDEEIPLFSEEELEQAARSMKNKKSPGPDGIPAEALKVIAKTRPQLLLNMYNDCLKEGTLPKSWKMQRLALISKRKEDPDSPSAYRRANRPLCMLDTPGKLLKRMLQPRLAAAVERAGNLSERQHGFRRDHSTIGAVEEVVRTAQIAQQGNHYSRKITVLATLDVGNASNSARWCNIHNALENTFKVPQYLPQMLRSCLRNRVVIYDTSEGPCRKEITAGAAQSSVLGPEL